MRFFVWFCLLVCFTLSMQETFKPVENVLWVYLSQTENCQKAKSQQIEKIRPRWQFCTLFYTWESKGKACEGKSIGGKWGRWGKIKLGAESLGWDKKYRIYPLYNGYRRTTVQCAPVHHVHPCFGPKLPGEKNLSFYFFNSIFTCLYLPTCFLHYKGILAFTFEHIMVQEILCNT